MAKLSSTVIYGDLNVSGEIKNKASTEQEGVVKLNDTVSSASTTEGATANAVKKVNDSLSTHVSNTTSHITASERTTWNGKANASHTHTKSEITDFPTSLPANGGNSATATKLQTARTITLGGDISGSASFDGSSDVTIIGRRKVVKCGNYSTASATNIYFKVASFSTSSNYTDARVTFYVASDYSSSSSGFLHAMVRRGGSISSYDKKELVWITNDRIDPNNFYLLYGNDGTNTIFEIWMKNSSDYISYRFNVIDEGIRYSTNNIWTLHDSAVGESTLPTNLSAVTSTVASLSNNSATATKLETARTIALTGSVIGSGTFDGGGNLSIATSTNHTHNYAGSSTPGGSATSALACIGNSATATKLQTARTIALGGQISGSAIFDGSGNITITTKEGYSTTSSGEYSHAEGWGTKAIQWASHAEGTETTASGSSSHAEGEGTTAIGASSHAEGCYTTASGSYSHAEGDNTMASGICSHAEGEETEANNYYAHAEGSYTVASGQSSHAEGDSTTASGDYSHAEGQNTIASEYYSHAEGVDTTSSGEASHAEGMTTTASGNSSHAEGEGSKAIGESSHAQGVGTNASGYISHAEGSNTTAETYAIHVQGRYNKVNSGNATSYISTQNAFVIGNGTSSIAKSNAFRITFDGKVYGLSAFNSTGADYAEYFEWSDGNVNNEDRVGKFVTLEGDKIRLANENDEFILGIVSGNPAIIGNASDDSWNDMYMRDKYGRLIYEDVQVEDEKTKELKTEKHIKLNPNYNYELEYIPRSERKEWSTIGMLGQLIVDDNGTCKVNGYCKCDSNGVATDSSSGYRVLKRIDDSTILILFK